tara:strand:- start:31659 stop:32738 length:1080 start_codon:yes stop_codon:yes gene_type:complete
MSGTSMDAIDAALVEFDNKAKLKFYREYPIDQSLRRRIRLIDDKSSIGDIATLDQELGHRFADAVNKLLKETGIPASKISAIGSHGQTILHRPTGPQKTSLQIADPNVICAETNITTVTDFRRMDMAHGGQGAPLASAFHQYQFQQNSKSVIILNIGGIANITLLHADNSKVIGFDTGPGNGLLDDWVQINKNEEYDKDGEWAKTGKPHKKLLALMLTDHYFTLPAPKSTGREYFNMDWLKVYLEKINSNITAKDVQATLLQLSTITIRDAINASSDNIDEVLVCGGGAKNLLLMETLNRLLNDTSLSTTDKYGLSPDCIEAVTFAWLAKQRLENKPANLPNVTGAKKEVLLGGVYSPY